MEIGSFIELQLPNGLEFYSENNKGNIARLNSGRAAIWHALRILECNAVWIPYYQCDTVREFLKIKNCDIKYYHINSNFEPIDINQKDNEAVLLVNYYGIFSSSHMSELSQKYSNVIIDNSQSFFSVPLDGCMNVYSARKFVGVPDGAYVIGNGAEKYVEEYEQGYSSDTADFLLKRIEYGCEGKTYESRMINEHRIDGEDIKKMSLLTRYIIDGTDYDYIIKKRRINFEYAKKALDCINKIDVSKYYDEECVPMVYPLVVCDDDLLKKLISAKHFQGHWWRYLLNEVSEDSFEYWISKYIIPITIDQRYGEEEIDYIVKIVKGI